MRRKASLSFLYPKGRVTPVSDSVMDRLEIRRLIEDWVILRDARLWDGFRIDGPMLADLYASGSRWLAGQQHGWPEH